MGLFVTDRRIFAHPDWRDLAPPRWTKRHPRGAHLFGMSKKSILWPMSRLICNTWPDLSDPVPRAPALRHAWAQPALAWGCRRTCCPTCPTERERRADAADALWRELGGRAAGRQDRADAMEDDDLKGNTIRVTRRRGVPLMPSRYLPLSGQMIAD